MELPAYRYEALRNKISEQQRQMQEQDAAAAALAARDEYAGAITT